MFTLSIFANVYNFSGSSSTFDFGVLGQEFTVSLQSESNGRFSEIASFVQSLPPDVILGLTANAFPTQIDLQFQIQSGEGSKITVLYHALTSGIKSSQDFEFR